MKVRLALVQPSAGGLCVSHRRTVRQLPSGAEKYSCCWQHDDLRLRHHQRIPATASFRDGEVQFSSQMRNSHPEAGWLYRGDRKPNQVSQVSSLPHNPWNILPLIGSWLVGQRDLDVTKLLSRERRGLDE